MIEVVTLRPCCRAKSGAYDAPQYIDHPEQARVSIEDEETRPARQVPASALMRNRELACHEAGHTVAALSLGATVSSVTVEHQPHAAITETGVRLAERMAILIAGRVAELWAHRTVVRPGDPVITESIERTRMLRGGSCDECKIARLLQVELRHPKDNAPILARYREIELATIEFVTARAVWRIVEKLATALLERGTMSEDEINALIGADISALDVRLVV